MNTTKTFLVYNGETGQWALTANDGGRYRLVSTHASYELAAVAQTRLQRLLAA